MARSETLPDLKTLQAPPDLLSQLSDCFIRGAQLSEQIKLLEEEKKEVQQNLLGLFRLLGVPGCSVEDWIAYRWTPSRSTISAERLVEAGVPADVVAACTVTTVSPETVTIRAKGGKQT